MKSNGNENDTRHLWYKDNLNMMEQVDLFLLLWKWQAAQIKVLVRQKTYFQPENRLLQSPKGSQMQASLSCKYSEDHNIVKIPLA